MALWWVESHHINVKVGDCAIHILRKRVQPDVYTVEKAVLIDGGTSSVSEKLKACPNASKSMIKKLTTQYGLSSTLQFQTIVVSHWDEDHYGGLVNLMFDDMVIAKTKKLKPSQVLDYLLWDAETGKIPLTYLYCPNEKEVKTASGKSVTVNGLARRFRRGVEANTKQFIEVCVDKELPKNKVDGTWEPFAILKSAEDNVFDVLGVDFFRNQRLLSDPGSITPAQLMQRNTPQTGVPGMYCIGVKNQTFQTGNVEIVPERVTKTNQWSIAAVILWDQGLNPPKCSHYFAGDADDERERLYLGWLYQSAGVPNANGVQQITHMKLSHHGSRSSTPVTAVKFNPINIVMSNPTGLYFHPGWEIMFFLSVYLREASETPDLTPRMFATKYPFYFSTDQFGNYLNIGQATDKKPMLNTKAFDKPSQHNADLTGYIEQAYKKFVGWSARGNDSLNEMMAYKKAGKDGGKEYQRKILMDMVRARWAQFCWPEPKLYDNSDSPTPVPTLKPTTSSSDVECVTVYSTTIPEFEKINMVSYTLYNRQEPIQYTRPVKLVATKSTGMVSDKKRKAESALNLDPTASWTSVPVDTGVKKPKLVDTVLIPTVMVKLDAFVNAPGTNPDEMDLFNESEEEPDGSDDKIALKARQQKKLVKEVPILPLPPGTPLDDKGWYIYASLIPKVEIEAVTLRFTSIADTSPWDGFMATLHCAMIGLSGDPSEINQGSSIQLNEQDELSFWFQDVFNTGPSNVLMIRSADPASGYIGGFAISMPLVPLRKTLSTTDSPVVLLFTTAEGALNNTFDGSTPPSMGLRDGSTALTMALDNTSREPTSVTLEVLSRFVGLESLFENGVLSTLKNLNFVIPDPKNPGKGHRNALWFVPQQAYATTLRLQLDLSTEDLVTLQSFLDILNGTVTSAYIIARRKSIWMSNSAAISFETRGEMVLVTEMTIAGLTFDVVAEFSSGSVQFDVILKRKDGSVLDKMLNWLKTTFITDGGDDPFPFTQWLTQSAGPVSFPSFDFRRVAVVFSQSTSDSSKLKFRSFALDMELRMQINDQTVLSLIDFTYAAGSGGGPALTAELWTAPSYDVNDPALRLIPDFENYAWFEPLEQNGAVQDWPRYIDLKKLTGFGDSSPSIFPTLLSMAKFYIDKNTVAFSGTLRSVSSEEKSKPPIFAIDMIDLAASYTFGSGKDAAIDCMLGVSASIQAPPETKLDAAELKGGFAYEGARERWILSGSIENLCGAHFYQFFDSDSRSAAASLLDNIAVKRFDITYIYTAGQASDLDLKGTLGIGKLDFDLWYKNRGSGDWEFDASVTFGTGEAESTTLGEMLANVVGENDFNIPDFLGNITVSRKSSEDIVALKLCPDSTKTHLFFTMWVKLGDLRIQYIQFTPLKQQTGATATPSIKRVFLASIDALPKINIPVLGDITQPFDEALALWVQPQLNSEGLTLEDVNSINDLITKAPLSQKALPHKPNTGLRNGVHLMLVLKDNKGDTNVVVDYIFGDKKPDSTALLTGEDEFPSENGESGMATYSKSYGGLSVRNVGLKYTGSILSIKVDAAVKFGPIDFALLGFTIDLDFSSEARASLFNLPKPSISIQGLEAGYNSPPVVVGGMLLHVSDEKMDLWQGALAGSFQPWAFAVAGCYGTIKDLEAYKTFFLYARLLGPLITFEFATITGVTAGFGYNSSMQFPAVSDITKYPLLSVPDPPKDAQTAIQQLTRTAWFKGKNNSFWIAAGLDVNAFQMLDVSAVLAIEFDPNVKIGLFAIGTAVIPNEKAGKAKFAQIQLALTAVIDFAAGTMKIDGQLTPASFILDPNCHLTGGFGLYTWFGDAAPELKGDWVFTIGGYHRLFKPPPQYPHPPRLGISWQFNNAISIRGEAYFAITPKVCMGGGRWDVSLRLGPLEAYYSAFVDFLISFKPFYFIADGGVTVGVRYTMDLWLVTLRISVELSATLHIEGPPIHGYVHVDFWVFGFNIAFGDSSSEAQKLSLKEFLDLACQVSESAASDMFQTILGSTPVGGPLPLKTQERTIGDQKVTEVEDDAREPHVLVVQSGLVPDGKPESRPSGGPWTVRAATFSFAVSCKVALSKATIITGKLESSMTDDDDAEAESVVQGTGNSIYARPMCDESAKPDLGTELFVTIKPVESKQKLLADGTTVEADIPEWNDNSGIVKNLPTGLWGKYDRSIDPRRNPNASSLLDGNKEGTVSLLCGVVVRVPKSLVSVADTTKPFDYKKFMVQEIGGQYGFAKLRPNEAKFLPAPPEGKTQWDSVKSAWKSPGMGGEAPITVVDMWQDMGLSDLGWDPAKVGKTSDDPRKPKVPLEPALSGKIPKQLVDGLEDFYLWAPFLSAVPS